MYIMNITESSPQSKSTTENKRSTRELVDDFQYTSLRYYLKGLSDDKISSFLEDNDAIMKFVDQKSKESKAVRQQIWELFSIIPLNSGMQRYIREKLGVNEVAEVSEAQNEQQVLAWAPTRVNLPFGSLPSIETFSKSTVYASSLELPRASVYITNQSGEIDEMSLTSQETTVALSYVRKKISDIKKNRKYWKKRYIEEKGIATDVEVSFIKIKKFALENLLKTRLIDIIKDSHLDSEEPIDFDNSNFELRFTQTIRGSSNKQIAELVEGEDDEINDFFKNKMIPMSVADPYLDIGNFEWQETTKTDTVPVYPLEAKTEQLSSFNELQKAYIEVSRATKAGEWDKAIEIYIQYIEYWPQYLEHRIAVLDMIDKVDKNILDRMPRQILSIASGPHEELRAQWDIHKKNPDYEMPFVVSLDSSAQMLECSGKSLEESAKDQSLDVVADMREIDEHFNDHDFDVVECSSFDNLSDESEIKHMILQSIKKTRVGGVLRFFTVQSISSQFSEVLNASGMTVLESNTKPKLSSEAKEKITQEKGKDVADRIGYKLKRLNYFLVRVDSDVDLNSLDQDLKSAELYKVKEKKTSSNVEKKLKSSIESKLFDYNVNAIVALNPIFFLKKKNLEIEYLHYALTNLKGKVDFSVALRLYKIYFTSQHSDELAEFHSTVFDIISEYPQAKEYLSIDNLKHPDQKIRTKMEKYVAANITSFFDYLFSGAIDQEARKNILKKTKYNKEIKNKLSNKVRSLFDSEKYSEIEDLLNDLPARAKLQLPAEMIRVESLKSCYYDCSNKKITKDELNSLLQDEQFIDTIINEEDHRSIDFILNIIKKAKKPVKKASALIAKLFFEEKASSLYERYKETLIEIVVNNQTEYPRESFFLLENSEQETKNELEQKMEQNPDENLIRILSSRDLSPETRRRLIGKIEFTDERLEKISIYIDDCIAWGSISRGIENSLIILESLPENVKLHLPIELSSYPETIKQYFKYAKETENPDSIGSKQLTNLYEAGDELLTQQKRFIAVAVNKVFAENGLYSPQLARKVYKFLNEHPEDLTSVNQDLVIKIVENSIRNQETTNEEREAMIDFIILKINTGKSRLETFAKRIYGYLSRGMSEAEAPEIIRKKFGLSPDFTEKRLETLLLKGIEVGEVAEEMIKLDLHRFTLTTMKNVTPHNTKKTVWGNEVKIRAGISGYLPNNIKVIIKDENMPTGFEYERDKASHTLEITGAGDEEKSLSGRIIKKD